MVVALLAAVGWGCASLTPLVDTTEQSAELVGQAESQVSALEQYKLSKKKRAAEQAVQPPYVAVLLFEDESGFREDVWDLKREMAQLLSHKLVAVSEWRVVPFAAVEEVLAGRRKLKGDEVFEVGRILEADVLFLGTIEDYDMKRLSVGDPLLGGYKSYSGIAMMQVRAMQVTERRELGVAKASQEMNDRDLGLDLLGKPREQDLQFTGLRDIAFGSEPFEENLLGRATMAAIEELVGGLVALFQPDELKLDGRVPELLSVHGEDVYINIGSENGLRIGYRFAVYLGLGRAEESGGDAQGRIGVVEVREIIGARLSSVRILQDGENMQAGDRLGVLEAAGD
jgi:hypothetical protein